MKAESMRMIVGLVAVVVLAAMAIYVVATGGFAGLGSIKEPMEIVADRLPSGVRELKVGFSGSEKITRTSGHAHSPFGVHGKNTYRFRGKVRIGEQSWRLDSDQFFPISVFEVGDEKFLLLRHYFRKASFKWMRLESGDRIVEADYVGVPEALRMIELKDALMAYKFRAWNLESLANRSSTADACQLFINYGAADARFVYPGDWDDLGSCTEELDSFIHNRIIEQQCRSCCDTMIAALEAGRPADYRGILSDLGSAIYQLDKENGRRYLCEFIERIRAEGNSVDKRLDALADPKYLGGLLDCGSLSPAPTP